MWHEILSSNACDTKKKNNIVAISHLRDVLVILKPTPGRKQLSFFSGVDFALWKCVPAAHAVWKHST